MTEVLQSNAINGLLDPVRERLITLSRVQAWAESEITWADEKLGNPHVEEVERAARKRSAEMVLNIVKGWEA